MLYGCCTTLPFLTILHSMVGRTNSKELAPGLLWNVNIFSLLCLCLCWGLYFRWCVFWYQQKNSPVSPPFGLCPHSFGLYLHLLDLCPHPFGLCLHPLGLCLHSLLPLQWYREVPEVLLCQGWYSLLSLPARRLWELPQLPPTGSSARCSCVA